MLERVVAQKIVDYLCGDGIIKEKESDVYVYAYELLLSSLISVFLVLSLSLVCGNILYAGAFLIGFVPLRIYIGGYHASSHFNCHLVFLIAFLTSVVLSYQIVATYRFRLIATFVLLIVAFVFAPVEAENKRLTSEKHKKYRHISICLAGIDVILVAINIMPQSRLATVYYFSKWMLIIFALIPVFRHKFSE